jgi:hypothetical protein
MSESSNIHYACVAIWNVVDDTVDGDGISHLELSIVLCSVSVFRNSSCCQTELSGCFPTLFLESGNRFISVLNMKGLTSPAIIVAVTVWTVKANIVMFFLWNSTVEVEIVVLSLFFLKWLLPTLIQTVTSDFISFYKIIYTRLDILTIWPPSFMKTEVISVWNVANYLPDCMVSQRKRHNMKKDSLCIFHFTAWLRKCSICHHTSCSLLDHYKIN